MLVFLIEQAKVGPQSTINYQTDYINYPFFPIS